MIARVAVPPSTGCSAGAAAAVAGADGVVAGADVAWAAGVAAAEGAAGVEAGAALELQPEMTRVMRSITLSKITPNL